MNKQSTIYSMVFMFIVAFAFVFLLSLTNEATREMVELNQEVARKRAVLSALGIESLSDEEVLSRFEDVEQLDRDDTTIFRATVDGETVYAKEFAGSGLWGTIEGVLGVNGEVSRTVGLEIINHNETPGLGGRITEAWFKEQFAGEQIAEAGIAFTAGDGDTDPANSEVDGITGATRTTESMERIVNSEIDRIDSLLGGS
ncbi:MAG: FMN-binding protein [Spirochaetes bacterium]|jgi:Na+-transporting NADH:ubiquinone oxidoreductase subunit C|nr:FMN-binding protein [Spirochaetota bacterium]